ncbi:MAG: DUF1385 domain-containing protein [Clostridia bacterium]|nr:DUF1385 domain-containing protein [Clostridia bacterium]
MAKNKQCDPCRKNKVGGQAVIEGVMMKRGEQTALATRCDDGTVDIKKNTFTPIKKKYKFLGIPIIRGVVGFIESMALSFKTMNESTEALGLEEEEGKLEKWLKKHLGLTITDIIMVIGMVLGIGLAVGLFMVLPAFLTGLWSDHVFVLNGYAKAGIEGAIRIVLFIAYLLLISLMKDIRRVFQYHGAEHKSIACYEAGLELTPENAKKCTRFHPRCGTSFMFVMILVGVLVGMLFPAEWLWWQRSLAKIATLPIVMGLGYEFIMFAGKHENFITKIFSSPGLWMQRITTKEPNEQQLAIAICAIKASMAEEFPDFDPSEYSIPVEENLDHIAFTGLSEKQKNAMIVALNKKRQAKADGTAKIEVIKVVALPKEL